VLGSGGTQAKRKKYCHKRSNCIYLKLGKNGHFQMEVMIVSCTKTKRKIVERGTEGENSYTHESRGGFWCSLDSLVGGDGGAWAGESTTPWKMEFI